MYDPWQLDGVAAYVSTQGMSTSALVHQFVFCFALNAAVVVDCHFGLDASDGHLCCRNRALTLCGWVQDADAASIPIIDRCVALSSDSHTPTLMRA